MREHFLGLAAIAVLLTVAYQASLRTTSTWGGFSATGLSGAEAYRPKFIPDSEAVVGRPHDGIRALPARRIEPSSGEAPKGRPLP
jgi:hypothetical protein